MERARLVIESRLKATEEKFGACRLPRIIRLCKRFKFSENETKMAIHALVCQGGFGNDEAHGYSRYGGVGIDCLSACHFVDASVLELLAFVSKERLHMEQGLFPEIQENYILNSPLSYDGDFCAALIGSKLSSNEFLKLEQTELAGVILEEPGSDYLK